MHHAEAASFATVPVRLRERAYLLMSSAFGSVVTDHLAMVRCCGEQVLARSYTL